MSLTPEQLDRIEEMALSAIERSAFEAPMISFQNPETVLDLVRAARLYFRLEAAIRYRHEQVCTPEWTDRGRHHPECTAEELE